MRFRHAKNMTDSEALTIMRALADNVGSYEQVVEVSGARNSAERFIWPRSLTHFRSAQLLASLPHGNGLLFLAFGLLHPRELVREATVDIFDQLRTFPVSFPYNIPWLGNRIADHWRPDISPNTGGSSLPTSAQSVPAVRLRAPSTCERKKASRTAGWTG
jgi:hypothetical protein